jgi:osmotically-inducible protein OsmY
VDGVGRLVGILTRSDALKVFLRSDAELRQEVVDDVIVRSLWMDPDPIRVTVSEGIVELKGQVDRRSDVQVLSEFVGALDGVVAVHAKGLSYRHDDN